MCEPLSIAATGLAIAGQVAGAKAEADRAKAVAEYQNKRYTDNAGAATTAYLDDISRLQIRQNQENEAAVQRSFGISRQYQRAAGTIATTAAARGVSGESVQNLLDDFQRLEAENQFAIQRNRAIREDQMYAQMRGLYADAQSRISRAAPRPVSGPSNLALGLQVGGSVLGGLDDYHRRQALLDAMKPRSQTT